MFLKMVYSPLISDPVTEQVFLSPLFFAHNDLWFYSQILDWPWKIFSWLLDLKSNRSDRHHTEKRTTVNYL